jgi:hypothetical protein
MTENPYQPPQEVGYVSPATEAWKRWLLDRLALVVCAFFVFVLVTLISLGLALFNSLPNR